MSKKTLANLSKSDLQGKRALVRADFNVPLDDSEISLTIPASEQLYPQSRI